MVDRRPLQAGLVRLSNIRCRRCLLPIQYLDPVEELGIQPQILRSDRGTETPMIADAHYQIALKLRTSITLKDCFFFGTSVANQRIESWWGQITKRALYRWRVRFYIYFV